MRERRLPSVLLSLLLVAPALLTVAFLFIYPLGCSAIIALEFIYPLGCSGAVALESEAGIANLGNFIKAFDFYGIDIRFTVIIVGASTLIVGVIAVAIGGYITLSDNRRAVMVLQWLYRWPLFIPFIVAGQIMRTFLAKNGLMNNMFVELGLLDVDQTVSFLDWTGLIITFVWKQTPFVALLVAGAMASLDQSTIEAARNLGASRLRILVEIIVPQVRQTLVVGLILSFVVMMSVLSVPLMVSGESPTMITVDMAFRINFYGDYGVANALGFISYVMTGMVAWIYLRQGVKEGAQP